MAGNRELRLAWVCVNGILNWPGASEGWTDRAVTWLQTMTPDKAEKWEYAAGPLTRRLRQQRRAEKIARLIGYYQRAGFAVVLVGHSNGCDLIAPVLALRGVEEADARRAPYFTEPIRSAHLVAAAADWDDFRNALAMGDVERIHLYGSAHDPALRLAGISRRLFGWLGLGYGTLGLECGRPEDAPPQRVWPHPSYQLGHSRWWERGRNFEITMRLLTRNERDFADLKLPPSTS